MAITSILYNECLRRRCVTKKGNVAQVEFHIIDNASFIVAVVISPDFPDSMYTNTGSCIPTEEQVGIFKMQITAKALDTTSVPSLGLRAPGSSTLALEWPGTCVLDFRTMSCGFPGLTMDLSGKLLSCSNRYNFRSSRAS